MAAAPTATSGAGGGLASTQQLRPASAMTGGGGDFGADIKGATDRV